MTKEELENFIEKCEGSLKDEFAMIDRQSFENSRRVLKAFQDHHLSMAHLQRDMVMMI